MNDTALPEGIDPASAHSASKLIRNIDGGFTVELLRSLGKEDIKPLIKISQSLVDSFELKLLATKKDILRYFNPPSTLPFIARHHGDPVGFIIGVPLEHFSDMEWAAVDENLGAENTLYTYAFGIIPSHRGKGVASELKKTYLWWCRDRGYEYVTGCVREGISTQMGGDTRIISYFDDWNGTGIKFEYYRQTL